MSSGRVCGVASLSVPPRGDMNMARVAEPRIIEGYHRLALEVIPSNTILAQSHFELWSKGILGRKNEQTWPPFRPFENGSLEQNLFWAALRSAANSFNF